MGSLVRKRPESATVVRSGSATVVDPSPSATEWGTHERGTHPVHDDGFVMVLVLTLHVVHDHHDDLSLEVEDAQARRPVLGRDAGHLVMLVEYEHDLVDVVCALCHALAERDVSVVVESEHHDGHVVLERVVDGVEELLAHTEVPRVDPLVLHYLDLTVDEPRRRGHSNFTLLSSIDRGCKNLLQ